MNGLQMQARALGDPTRHELFRYIADAGRPVDVAELTEHLGLHHNAIRQHLAKLVEAGLVSEATAPRVGRGRPRLVYTVDPSAESRWGVTGPYERLTLLLTEIIRTRRLAGRRRPSRRPARAHRNDRRRSSGGFGRTRWSDTGSSRPRLAEGNKVDIVLGACPFETTALADPDTVCGLHLGLALGSRRFTRRARHRRARPTRSASRDMPPALSHRIMTGPMDTLGDRMRELHAAGWSAATLDRRRWAEV